MFSNTMFLKIAVRNDNQNMCVNLIPQRKYMMDGQPELTQVCPPSF